MELGGGLKLTIGYSGALAFNLAKPKKEKDEGD
jgi:hypothetical protein